jgi:hypothetical protein
VPIRFAEPPQWSRSFRHSRFNVVGRPSPSIITDVRELDTASLLIHVDTPAQAEALRTITASPVLLLRFPPSFGERDRYIFVSDSGTQRLGRLAITPQRHVPLSVVEIADPDEIPGFAIPSQPQ